MSRFGQFGGFDDFGSGFGSFGFGARPRAAFPPLDEEETESALSSLVKLPLSALGFAANVLGTPGSVVTGLLAGEPGRALGGIFDPSQRVGGREMLEKWGALQPNQPGFDMGDVAGFGAEVLTDPLSYLGIGALTKAGKAAEKAGTLTKGIGAGIRSGERSLIGLDPLPFGLNRLEMFGGSRPFTLGTTGDLSAATGDVLDAGLNKVSQFGPVRYARSLLDTGVGEARSVPGQAAYEQLGFPLKQQLTQQSAEALQGLRRQFDPTIEAFSGLKAGPAEDELSRLVTQHAESAMGRPMDFAEYALDLQQRSPVRYQMLQQAGDIPALQSAFQGATQMGQKLGQFTRDFLPSEKALGLKSSKLDDVVEYFTRSRAAAPGVDQGGFLGKIRGAFSAAHGSQVKRKFRGLPGGTIQLEDLTKNQLVSGVGRTLKGDDLDWFLYHEFDSPGAGVNALAQKPTMAVKDVAELARSQVLGLASAQGSKVGLDEFMKVARKLGMDEADLGKALGVSPMQLKTLGVSEAAFDEAVKLAGRIGHTKKLGRYLEDLAPEYASQKWSLFEKDPFKVAAQRAGRSAESQSGAAATLEVIRQTAKPMSDYAPGEGVKVLDVLRNAQGFAPVQALKILLNSLQPQSLQGLSKGEQLRAMARMAVPADVARDVARFTGAYKGEIGPVRRIYDGVQQWFKDFVTLPFPAKHFRDMTSGLFQMWRDDAIAGPGIGAALKTVYRGLPLEGVKPEWKQAVGLAANAADDAATNALIDAAVSRGVAFTQGSRLASEPSLFRGQKVNPALRDEIFGPLRGKLSGQGAVGQLTEWGKGFAPEFQPGTGLGGKASATYRNTIEQLRKGGDTSSDFIRFAHFLNKVDQGYSLDAAAMAVKKYHFDFSELTRTEKEVFRRLFPWWSWSKKNIPSIVTDMATQPAKLAATVRGMQSGRKEGYVPAYVGETSAVPVPGAPEGQQRFISSFGTNVEDEMLGALLNLGRGRFLKGGEQLLGQMSPIIKGPLEAITGRQFFSGRNLADLRPSAVGKTLAAPFSEEYAQPLTQLIANTPFSRFATSLDKVLDTQALGGRKGTVPTFANLLTGARVTDVDQKKALEIEARPFLQQELSASGKARIFPTLTIPEEKQASLTPEQNLQMRLYTTLLQNAKIAALEKKAAAGAPGAAEELAKLKARKAVR